MYVVYVLCLVFLCLFGVVWFANVEKNQIGGIGWEKCFVFVGCCCRDAPWHVSTRVLLRCIKFIIHPIRHIVFNIIRNAVHFRDVTNDVVVETGLPGEIEGVFIGIFGCCRF